VRQNKGDKRKILNVLSNCKTATTNNVPELSSRAKLHDDYDPDFILMRIKKN